LHVPPRPGVVRTGFSGGVHAHAITASGAMLTLVAGSSPQRAKEAVRLGVSRPGRG